MARDWCTSCWQSPLHSAHSCCCLQARGYGLYPQAAMLNHDCMPNVCRFDDFDSRGVSLAGMRAHKCAHILIVQDVKKRSLNITIRALMDIKKGE